MTEETEKTTPEVDPRFEGLGIARQWVLKLADSVGLTAQERGKVYGEPEENFSNIAAMWNAYFRARHGEKWSQEFNLHSYDVGYLNALQKLARLGKTPLHPDSALDAGNYTWLGFGCAAWEDQLMAQAIMKYLEEMKAKAAAEEAAKSTQIIEPDEVINPEPRQKPVRHK